MPVLKDRRVSYGNSSYHMSGFIWAACLFWSLEYRSFFPTFFNDVSTESASTNGMLASANALGVIVLGAMLLASFEASALRRYLRGDRFRLRFSKDEFRISCVYLIWILLLMVSYFAVAIVVGLVGGVFTLGVANSGSNAIAILAAIVASIVFLSIPALMLAIVAKFCAASAITMRDQKFTFIPAARVTIGRFWKVFSIYSLVYLGAILAFAAAQFPLLFIMGSTGNTTTQTSPALFLFGALAAVVVPAVTAFVQLVTLGMTSKLALTDPGWPGYGDSIAEAFR